ncbi:DNA excision repair protein ERCC-5, partial [Tremellales sp. Uapishka_1]
MGVKGLWSLLNPVARPVQLESMEGKRLAIDSSIWLYQVGWKQTKLVAFTYVAKFQATMRDKDGRVLVNAHVLGFLRRINKLLFHGIKPVFVFDGGAPALKRSTIAERKRKKAGAAANHARMAEKLFAAQMRREAVKAAQATREQQEVRRAARQTAYDEEEGEQIADDAVYLEELEGRPGAARPRNSDPRVPTTSKQSTISAAGGVGTPDSILKKKKDFKSHDPYRLPAVEMTTVSTEDKPDARLATEEELKQFIDDIRPEDVDIESPEFRALPTEVQYEIIGDLRVRSRQQSHKRLKDMLRAAPTALDFSMAQIKNLSQRNQLTQQLLTVTDSVGKAHLTIPVRIAAERNREYVLVKRGENDGGGWALGIREGTKAKPIVVDEEKPVVEESDEDDSDIEEVEPPIVSVDEDLQEHRRREILEAIASRYTPQKPAKPSLDLPVKSFGAKRAPGSKPLFETDEPSPEPTENDEALALALQHEELGGSILGSDDSMEMEEVPLVPSGRNTPVDYSVADDEEDQDFEDVSVVPTPEELSPPRAMNDLDMLLMENQIVQPMEPATGLPANDAGTAGLATSTGPIDLTNEQEDDIILIPRPQPLVQASRTRSSSTSTFVEEADDEEIVTVSQPTAMTSSLTQTAREDLRRGPPSTARSSTHTPTVLPPLPRLAVDKTHPRSGRPDPPLPPTAAGTPPTAPPTSVAAIPPPPARERFDPPPAPSSPSPPLFSSPTQEPIVIDDGVLDHTSPSPQPIPPQQRTASPEPESDHDDSRSIEWSKSPSPKPSRPPLAAEISTTSIQTEGENDDDMDREDMVAEEDDYARFMAQIKNRDLNEVRTEIDDEIRILNNQNKVALRDSDEITQAMVAQIQSLLRHFGIPYITAPMEAEAQCAKLAELDLVDGIITDDSDVFLFGGKQCFKNIFNDAKYAECFMLSDLDRELSLTRDRLISLAYLLGSDYTIGLAGVGPVVAMELMANFPGPNGLLEFKAWWIKVQKGLDVGEEDTKWKKSFKKRFASSIFLEPDWPNGLVREAYIYPTTDESEEPFHWGFPKLSALRTFLHEELSWSISKVDDELTPIVQRIARRGKTGALNVQSSLLPFFDHSIASSTGGNYAPRRRTTANVSKRLMSVIKAYREAEARLRGEQVDGWGEMMVGLDEEDPKGRGTGKRKKSESVLAEVEKVEIDGGNEDEGEGERGRKKRKTRGRARATASMSTSRSDIGSESVASSSGDTSASTGGRGS